MKNLIILSYLKYKKWVNFKINNKKLEKKIYHIIILNNFKNNIIIYYSYDCNFLKVKFRFLDIFK